MNQLLRQTPRTNLPKIKSLMWSQKFCKAAWRQKLNKSYIKVARKITKSLLHSHHNLRLIRNSTKKKKKAMKSTLCSRYSNQRSSCITFTSIRRHNGRTHLLHLPKTLPPQTSCTTPTKILNHTCDTYLTTNKCTTIKNFTRAFKTSQTTSSAS